MSKKPIIFIIIFVALALGGGLYLNSQPDPLEPPANSGQSNQSDQTAGSETSQATGSGSYVDYSDSVIAETSGTKVLFFHAPWCPQCRSIEKGIDAQGVPGGLTIIKVDYDSNQSLRQKYGVTIQTTFVKINDAGEFVSRYVAYDEPTWDAVKRNYL